jgi:hypothetical protein
MVKINLSQIILFCTDIHRICQLLNNFLETEDNKKNLRNFPLLKDVLSVEEYVLGCMGDSFRS